MSLKDFAKAAMALTAQVTGFGGVFAAMTPGTKDDQAIARIQQGALTFQGLVGVVEDAQLWREATGTSGEAAAQGAGAKIATMIVGAFTSAGWKVREEKVEQLKKASAALAGAVADIRDCFRK